MAKRT